MVEAPLHSLVLPALHMYVRRQRVLTKSAVQCMDRWVQMSWVFTWDTCIVSHVVPVWNAKDIWARQI